MRRKRRNREWGMKRRSSEKKREEDEQREGERRSREKKGVQETESGKDHRKKTSRSMWMINGKKLRSST